MALLHIGCPLLLRALGVMRAPILQHQAPRSAHRVRLVALQSTRGQAVALCVRLEATRLQSPRAPSVLLARSLLLSLRGPPVLLALMASTKLV